MVKLLLVCLAVCVAATSASKCSYLVKNVPKGAELVPLDCFLNVELNCVAVDTILNEKRQPFFLKFHKEFCDQTLIADMYNGDLLNGTVLFETYNPREYAKNIILAKGYPGTWDMIYLVNNQFNVNGYKVVVSRLCNLDYEQEGRPHFAVWSYKNDPALSLKEAIKLIKKLDPSANVVAPGTRR